MNGAEAILRTLANNGLEVCFANPGTSEMQMVSAFDREPRVRPILCLFEGVATGAADGYARMAGKPGLTLLHLGAGLANGSANLHNARRAHSPVVNIIGDHATYHRALDALLNSDIAGLARPNSIVGQNGRDAERGCGSRVGSDRRLPDHHGYILHKIHSCKVCPLSPVTNSLHWFSYRQGQTEKYWKI